MWLDTVNRESNDKLDICWKYFQLDQVNGNSSLELRYWDQCAIDLIEDSRSLLAAIAGESVRKHQPELFDVFHTTLLEKRHASTGTRIPLNDKSTLIEIARDIGIDIDVLSRDLEDCSLIELISQSHYEAIETHGVFGTPTFVFENSNSVYLKTFIPPVEDAVQFFNEFSSMMGNRSYIGELKRPQPPWPRGIAN